MKQSKHWIARSLLLEKEEFNGTMNGVVYGGTALILPCRLLVVPLVRWLPLSAIAMHALLCFDRALL